MGVKISIDKHVSELDDILEMSPTYLSRVQFESKVGPEVTQHLKVRNSILCMFPKLSANKAVITTMVYRLCAIFQIIFEW